jgi:hypothetical protein
MLESKFLGGLLPSHPDFEPIIDATRAKYHLAEIYPQDDPIEEIYLDDEIVSLEAFNKDIRNQILGNMETMFPEDFVKKYRSAKQVSGADFQKELEKFPDELRPTMEMLLESTKGSAQTIYQILDAQIDAITKMICSNLLLGDSMEAPEVWFGTVFTTDAEGDTIIIAMINEITNLDLMFRQIRGLHKKTFGKEPTKITEKTASTAYFLQLIRRNKDREFVLDEFIRLNKFSMPKDRNSPRYIEIRNKYWQRLRKRLKKAEAILQTIVREKN